jgi:hypothetical protein
MQWLSAILLSFFGVLPVAVAPRPQDSYFVVVFSYEGPNGMMEPAATHTFATWVCMRDEQIVDRVVINWSPRDTFVEFFKEVPGSNHTLKESVDFAIENDRKMSYWVLRTDMTFFEEAKKQRDSLVTYKALDRKTRPQAVNCIHAVSDTAGFLDTGTASGIEVGSRVTDFFIKQQKAWITSKSDIAKIVLNDAGCKIKK